MMRNLITNLLVEIFRIPVLALWYASGWRVDGDLPDIDKYILIAVPHTTNWDYVQMIAMAFYFRRKPSTLVKTEVFDWFLIGGLVRWIGGIPITRGRSENAVQKAIEIVQSRQRVTLVITPEGTRRKTDHWKSGFYHVALGADIPIVLGYLDYKRKRGGGGLVMDVTGDIEADLARISAFYAKHGHGKYDENKGEIRFRESK